MEGDWEGFNIWGVMDLFHCLQSGSAFISNLLCNLEGGCFQIKIHFIISEFVTEISQCS